MSLEEGKACLYKTLLKNNNMTLPEKLKLTETTYGTYVSPTGLEYIKNADGQFVFASSVALQQQKAPVVNVGGVIRNIKQFNENMDWNVYGERLE